MATNIGTAVDSNHFWRFNYPFEGAIFDLRKRRFARYKDEKYTDKQLARKLTLDLMFFPKHIETLSWEPEKNLKSIYFRK